MGNDVCFTCEEYEQVLAESVCAEYHLKRRVEALYAENAAMYAEIATLKADLARVVEERDNALQCIHNIDDALLRGKVVLNQWRGPKEDD